MEGDVHDCTFVSKTGHPTGTPGGNERAGERSDITALMFAARSGNAVAVKVLVEEGGADTQLRNSRGHSALDVLVGGANALEATRMLLGGGL